MCSPIEKQFTVLLSSFKMNLSGCERKKICQCMIFITGTGTGVGKTFLSCLILSKYGNDKDLSYWKPVQTGTEKDSDSVRKISSVRIIPTVYDFTFPASPHFSAEKENREIDFEFLLNEMQQKKSERIISEGAGGILVPLNRRFVFADLLEKLQIPVLVSASSELGTVNHTLLTLQNLRNRNIPVHGFFFCGRKNETSEDSAETIEDFSGIKFLGRTDFPDRSLSEKEFRKYAEENFDHDFIIKDIL